MDELYLDIMIKMPTEWGSYKVQFEEMSGWNADSRCFHAVKPWNNRRTPLYIDGRPRRENKSSCTFGTGTFGNDLLIMDEPTNDLDFETIGWLEFLGEL
jgi:hypothetical protein